MANTNEFLGFELTQIKTLRALGLGTEGAGGIVPFGVVVLVAPNEHVPLEGPTVPLPATNSPTDIQAAMVASWQDAIDEINARLLTVETNIRTLADKVNEIIDPTL